MKRIYPFLTLGLIMLLLMGSCNIPGTTPPPAVPDIPLVTVDLAGPQAGTPMRWPDGSILVYVPGGDFEMGGDTLDNPMHTVSMSSFWIQRSEVTNREYRLCVGLGICTPLKNEESRFVYGDAALTDHPVTGVTWEQAQAYCTWIRGNLPTEAQWEFSARGTGNNLFPWGNGEPTCDLANFKGCGDTSKTVGELPAGASPFGLFDAAGNVLEWVWDWYDGTYYLNSPPQDPPGPDSGSTRVVRSSSYLSSSPDLPVNKRLQLEPDKNRTDLGFRCVVKDLSYIAGACQASPIYAPGANPGGSSGGSTCAPPQVSRTTHGCSSGRGFGRADISGPFAIDLPDGCIQEGNSIICLGNGGSFSINVCGPCVATGEDSSCPVGYDPSSTGACTYAPGDCPDDMTPGPDGVCIPNECIDDGSGGGFNPFRDWERALCIVAAADAEGGPTCQSGYVMIETTETRGCFLPDSIPQNVCPEGTYYDTTVGGCARPAGSSGNACPDGQGPYMDGMCAPAECLDSLDGGGGCLGFDCWQQSMCAFVMSENPVCQAGYARVAGTGCVPLDSTGTGPAGGAAELSPCLAGFTYDPVAMCCQADTYAGCSAGQIASGETCISPSVGGSGSSNSSSCTTVDLQADMCGSNPGGPGGGPGCPAPAWCPLSWNSTTCTCEFN